MLELRLLAFDGSLRRPNSAGRVAVCRTQLEIATWLANTAGFSTCLDERGLLSSPTLCPAQNKVCVGVGACLHTAGHAPTTTHHPTYTCHV